MSELCPNVFPMIRYCATRVETLADALGQELSHAPADPFAEDLVLTRSGGIARWLTQRFSMAFGSSGHGDGVCARIRFLTFPQYAALLYGGEDPWSADALTPQVMAALDDIEDDESFTQVRAYLGDQATRPRRRFGFARSTANRFGAYARWNLEMVRHWSQNLFLGPDQSRLDSSQIWQARLWNLVCERVGSTPWEDADRLREQAAASQFARVAVFCPDLLRPVDEHLLTGLDSTHSVLVYSLRCDPLPENCDVWRIGRKLSRQLAFTTSALTRLTPDITVLHETTAPATFLGALQRQLSTGESIPADLDNSVHIHSCYGDQQVDVLASQLVDLLAEDPGLEPRDILVLVNRMEDHRRLLEAYFHPDDAADSDPRHRIRASVSASGPDDSSDADLLMFLMDLIPGRARSEDLLRLASFPTVTSQFGFSSADLDKITTLISSSGIRWGLNAAHRASQHMESFAQNTWMAGLGRMVLGVGISEDDLVYKGTVLPLDAVDSDTVRLVEALGQIIAHVRMCCETWAVPTDPAAWASRFHATLDFLTGTAWEAGTVGRILTELQIRPSQLLTLAEAQTLFSGLADQHVRRSSLLNGDLTLVELGTMSLVPHKVVVVFGLDADSFPRQPALDGDDLVGATIEDPRLSDDQIFYDALMAAREKFIAVYAGFDPATTAATPMPTPLIDLMSMARLCVSDPQSGQELLHVHSPLQGGTRIHTRTVPAPPQASAPLPSEVEIDDLGELYANPAAYWLRRNAGLIPSVLKESDPIATEVPMALTALDKWQIVTRMIRLLLTGKTPELITQAELRRGTLPPGQMGVAFAQDCLRQASSIVAQAQPILSEPLAWRSIALGSDQAPDLVGQVPVHGTAILEMMAGRVQPRQEIAAWAKVLALQVAHPDQAWKAVLVGARGTVTLIAPEPIQARQHLDCLRRTHQTGLVSALPLPPAPGAHLAKFMVHNLAPNMDDVERRLNDTWTREPSWPLIWPTPADMLAQQPTADEASPHTPTSRFMALAGEVYVPLLRAGGVS